MGHGDRPDTLPRWQVWLVFAATLMVSAGCRHALSGPGPRPSISVAAGAWGRCGKGAASTGAAYLTIINDGEVPDRLIAAASPVARVVELHETRMDGDVSRMRPVPSMEVPAHGVLELKRGGAHIMLIGMEDEKKLAGPTFPLTLTFEKSGERTVDVELREP